MAKIISTNDRLFSEAKKYLVGGVSSPVRSFNYVGGSPVLIKNGRGSRAFDYDNKEYIDYCLSWGALILGHANKPVIKALRNRINLGLGFGTTNKTEVELAGLIQKAVPFIKKIRFVNSGTEAVMAAVRLARGYTGKDKIIKFAHSYHGAADYLLASAGSGLASLSIPQSLGVPSDFIKHTIIAPHGDKEYLNKVFKKYGRQVAAVLIEPAGGNYGVIPPDIVFLKYLRAVTKKYGALLLADEVITGFRFCFGSLSKRLGITPDLICLGKIIGGGLPVGAYGGREEIMNYLAPQGKVYQASTFSGNPIVMQAGLSTLRVLARLKKSYRRWENLTGYLAGVIKREAELAKIALKVNSYGSMFSLKFKDKEKFRRFYRELLRQGVYFAPSEYEANFLSFAHTKKDIEKTAETVKLALRKISQGT